jgi:regulator of nonsense transcripts 1
MIGDELRLKLDVGSARLFGKPWEGTGHVLRILDGEVVLEMRNNMVPLEISEVGDTSGVCSSIFKCLKAVWSSWLQGYIIEFVWKSTSFDRMQTALKTFAVDDTSVSGYLYHK